MGLEIVSSLLSVSSSFNNYLHKMTKNGIVCIAR